MRCRRANVLPARRSQKGPRLLPRAVVEQIGMGALGKQFDPLRLVGGAVDPPAHFHRDHRILLAVKNENRGGDGADVALDVVFVGNQQAERQQK